VKSKKEIRIFKDAVAIITGGASGIGQALAEELARRGAQVVLADLQIEKAQEVAVQIKNTGGRAKAVKLDVTDFSSVERLVRETVEESGRLDYIFNNAGIAIGCAADNYTVEDWNKIIDINLRGVVNGVQAAYKIMIEQGFGHSGCRLRDNQACRSRAFQITAHGSDPAGNTRQRALPRCYSYAYFGGWEVRQNIKEHSARKSAGYVGRIKAHASGYICQKSVERDCQK
jgi:NAD(P)-dependent dehydrogenase (short-subunit alcohol dehydrogenase family)